jgi:hypothetical protein
MTYEVDEELQAWLNAGQGIDSPCMKDEYTRELLNRAFSEAWGSNVGRELKARVGDEYNQRIADQLAKRFASVVFYKGVPFRGRIEEVMSDLLLEAPPAPSRPAGVNEYGVNLNFEPSREKSAPTKEETGFAHAWIKTVKEKGIAAVKPKGGVVALTMPNGSIYEYSAQEADHLLTRCIGLGLVS